MPIHYKVGDVLQKPQLDIPGPKLLIHISNNQRAWGSGFVLALSKKWSQPEERYRSDPSCELGDIQIVQVEEDLFVVNMIAQILGYKNGQPPIRYWALKDCLLQVGIIAKAMNAKIVGPRFGSALAGGDWNVIEDIISKELPGLDVFIFDLPKGE